MRTKDWKAINTPQILVVGEDSNLQWSETVAKYAMFADYYFRNFPEDHGERSRNVESRNLFDYIMELTDHQLYWPCPYKQTTGFRNWVSMKVMPIFCRLPNPDASDNKTFPHFTNR